MQAHDADTDMFRKIYSKQELSEVGHGPWQSQLQPGEVIEGKIPLYFPPHSRGHI